MAKDSAGKPERYEPAVRRKPSRTELAAEVAALLERVEALEQRPGARIEPPVGTAIGDLVPALRDLLTAEPDSAGQEGMVVYAGIGRRGDGEVAWQSGRRWEDVFGLDRARGGRALAALSSPARLAIVEALVPGPVSRRQLHSRLDSSTAGQLNHHLRELLAAGLVEQPSRGVYQIPPQHVVPVLTLLSCVGDLVAGHSGQDAAATLAVE